MVVRASKTIVRSLDTTEKAVTSTEVFSDKYKVVSERLACFKPYFRGVLYMCH